LMNKVFMEYLDKFVVVFIDKVGPFRLFMISGCWGPTLRMAGAIFYCDYI
jgi:hypothetical protein